MSGGAGRMRAGSSSGAILLEVLLAVGLLGVVIACLLTAFQGSRRVESALRAGLGELGDTQRLLETLRADLLDAEALALGGESGAWLRLYPRRGDRENYLEYTRAVRGDELFRARVAGRGSEASLMLGGLRIEFALLEPGDAGKAVADSLAAPPGDEDAAPPAPIVGAPRMAKTLTLRLLPPHPVPGDGTALREYRVELPLPLPVLPPQEVGS